jgi:hypothetical protein
MATTESVELRIQACRIRSGPMSPIDVSIIKDRLSAKFYDVSNYVGCFYQISEESTLLVIYDIVVAFSIGKCQRVATLSQLGAVISIISEILDGAQISLVSSSGPNYQNSTSIYVEDEVNSMVAEYCLPGGSKGSCLWFGGLSENCHVTGSDLLDSFVTGERSVSEDPTTSLSTSPSSLDSIPPTLELSATKASTWRSFDEVTSRMYQNWPPSGRMVDSSVTITWVDSKGNPI